MSFLADDDRPKKKAAHEIDEDISSFSADELSARIALLEAEIDRLNAEKARKSAGRSAAENLFKR